MPRWMLLAAAVALIGTGLLLVAPPPRTAADPTSAWPAQRGPISAREVATVTDGNLTEVTLTYVSQQGEARAILWLPNRTNNTTRPPALVHMTGVGVRAEGARDLARFLGSFGVATLSVEKRGPPSGLWVWDLLRGFDLLKDPRTSRVDPLRIAVSGDSLGANMAVVAAATEPGLKGVLAISGFPDSRFGPDLDPSAVVGKIASRPVAVYHARDDPVVPFEKGRALFDLAREPKFFYPVNGTCHGYCPGMFPQIEEQVRQMLLVSK